MGTRAIAISLAACLGLVVLTALLLDWSLEKAIILAPVIVVVAGAAGFLVVLWAKIIRESIRSRRS
jgi:Na+-transporting NADH:ubiquinone oxidoreductase subunit NqrD